MLTFETAAIRGVSDIIKQLTVCATHWRLSWLSLINGVDVAL